MNGIKKMRERAGLSQVALSKILEVDTSTVCKWETAEVLPRTDKLPLLAKIFNCTIDDLFNDKGADLLTAEESPPTP